MAKYEYEYTINPPGNPEGYRLLKIKKGESFIFNFLDIEDPDHAILILTLEEDPIYLERYVDYLGDDKDRPFNLQEILTTIQ